MAIQLKPLNEQVMVITGASSGIGLTTALLAAKRGAKVVLAARSKATLDGLVGQVEALGGQAIAVECDVAGRAQVQAVADAAIRQFGRIDTWVNDAGVSIVGRLDVVTDADNRRLFDVNFWGTVYGSLIALPLLKHGGALINLGSELSEAAIPLQGMYSATKHAVKGFTDALRIEQQQVDGAAVSITLIQPTAVDTQYDDHARNYQPHDAKLPSPMIEPEQVAEAILDAAVTPRKDVKVGAASKLNTFLSNNLPGVAELIGGKQADRQERASNGGDHGGALHKPSEATEAGRAHGHHAKS